MEGKKIAFGFSKLKAPSKVVKPAAPSCSNKQFTNPTNNLQFIDCLENQSIKVKNEIVKEKTELIIPLKPSNLSQKTVILKKEPHTGSIEIKKEESSAINEDIKIPNGNSTTPVVQVKVEVVDNEDTNTLDAQARREILESLNNADTETDTKIFSLPLTTNAPKEGEKESTLDDYENIPIEQFGMAMLRGMGWKPDESKNKNKPMDVILRPKGLGLGADKSAVTTKPTANPDDNKLIKNCCVKITGGMYKNRYGKLESFNEDSGRIVVKLALDNEHVTVSESLAVRVTQNDYDKNSRVINMQKYEEYKDQDSKQSNEKKNVSRQRRSSSNERNEKTKQYSRQNQSHSDSGDEQDRKFKRNYENQRSQSRKDICSRTDNRDSYRKYSDNESPDQSRYNDRKYGKNKTKYKSNKKSSSKNERRESDDERYQRTSRKQNSDNPYSRSHDKTYSRNSSASSSEDEKSMKITSERRVREETKRDERKEREKRKERHRSSSSSKDSESEDERRRKKSKRKSKSSDEDRRKKSKKIKKPKHESSSSESDSEDEIKIKKSRRKSESSDEDRRRKTKRSKRESSSEGEERRKKKKKHDKKKKHR